MTTQQIQLSFDQDPGLSTERLWLFSDGQLRIGQRGFGRAPERTVNLRNRGLTYTRSSRVFKRFVIFPLFFIVFVIAGTEKLKQERILPPESLSGEVVLSVIGLWYTLKGFKPIETFRINDKQGNTIAEIYKPRKARLRYQDFVAAICKFIDE